MGLLRRCAENPELASVVRRQSAWVAIVSGSLLAIDLLLQDWSLAVLGVLTTTAALIIFVAVSRQGDDTWTTT